MEPETRLAERANAWFDAVAIRRSRRTFTAVPASAEELDALDSLCRGFRPHPDARVELVRAPSVDVFRGIIGGYGKITGAPHLLVVVASPGPSSDAHAGYAGEAAILESTALGLDTCWVGGFFSAAKVRTLITLAEGERAVAVSPVGFAVDDYSGTERVYSSMAGSRKRKPLEAIAEGDLATWPEWARAAIECARVAPSAVNRQPWRFRLDGGELVVGRDSGGASHAALDKALDCGIAMLHAELGARAAGVLGRWTDAAGGRDIARFALLGEEEEAR